jgi:hypothetical protein
MRDEGETVHAPVRRRSLFYALIGNAVLLCTLLTLLSVHTHQQRPRASTLILLPYRPRLAHTLRLGFALVEPTPAYPPEP